MWNVIKQYLPLFSTSPTLVRLSCIVLMASLSVVPMSVQAKPKTKVSVTKVRVKSKKAVPKAKTRPLSHAKVTDVKAQARIKNRRKLLESSHKKIANVPLTPEQKRRDAEEKRLARAENRVYLSDQVHWKSGAVGRHWPLSQMSETMERSLKKVMTRLKMQLGKPYVWGGTSPKTGFDCSGLVWYAYTKDGRRSMPRTANGMFTAKKYKKVKQNKLHRGDLVFFGIHKKNKADHVGVYLGEGKFIEAPRTGLNVRISQLSDDFWQDHYLGSRRVIYD